MCGLIKQHPGECCQDRQGSVCDESCLRVFFFVCVCVCDRERVRELKRQSESHAGGLNKITDSMA